MGKRLQAERVHEVLRDLMECEHVYREMTQVSMAKCAREDRPPPSILDITRAEHEVLEERAFGCCMVSSVGRCAPEQEDDAVGADAGPDEGFFEEDLACEDPLLIHVWCVAPE